MSDAVAIETKVGPVWQGDGSIVTNPRAGNTGELITGGAHAKYFEAASRGKVFHACNGAAITFGTALTATGVTFHLCNPIGSPVNLVVIHCGLTIITATTSGSIVYAANPVSATAVTAGTALTVLNGLLSGSAGYGLAKSATTLPAAPVAIRALATGFFVGTTPAMAAGAAILDVVDGAIVVAPGSQLSVQGITVVGTGLVSMAWEEVPIR